jgi:hypothetical protein
MRYQILQNVFNNHPYFQLVDMENIGLLNVEKAGDGANPNNFPDMTVNMDPWVKDNLLKILLFVWIIQA